MQSGATGIAHPDNTGDRMLLPVWDGRVSNLLPFASLLYFLDILYHAETHGAMCALENTWSHVWAILHDGNIEWDHSIGGKFEEVCP